MAGGVQSITATRGRDPGKEIVKGRYEREGGEREWREAKTILVCGGDGGATSLEGGGVEVSGWKGG